MLVAVVIRMMGFRKREGLEFAGPLTAAGWLFVKGLVRDDGLCGCGAGSKDTMRMRREEYGMKEK